MTRLGSRSRLALLLASAWCVPMMVHAADHTDSTNATNESLADITDVYAWLSDDASKLNLIANVAPNAAAGTAFSTNIQYAFHVNSASAFGETETETVIICQFYDTDRIECWAGDEYVEGDPSNTAGIASTSGDLKVFAGMRDDPFFMEFTGFTNTAGAVIAAVAGGLGDDDNDGCPDVDSSTSATLVGLLQGEGSATNTFAGQNILSLAIEVDVDVINSGGPVLGVWASTHRAN